MQLLARVAVLLLVLARAALAQEKPAEPSAHPNIVFILADDLRADCLHIAGNADIHTPNLDRLAHQSAYFTRATVHVAQCSPARAMFITGLAPHQSGYTSIDIQQGRRGRPDGLSDLATVPGLLHGEGYRTVLVGKWHLGPDPWLSGFSDIRHWFPGGMASYADVPLCCGPSRKEEVVKGYVNEVFADDAISFLSSKEAQGGPFFLWLASTAPHEPCGPTPDRIGEFYKDKTDDDLVLPGIPKGASARWKGQWLAYYRAVTHLDEQVGRVLAAIDKNGLAGSTVVIFTSDSGIMMGRRGIDSKVVPYEDSVRIPIMIRDPRQPKPPQPSPAPVSALDLPVTILAKAGLKPPAPWPGRDLSLLASGKPDPAIRDAVCEWVDDASPQWGRWAFRSITDGRYKLIVWADAKKPIELYDLDADPHEEHNLAAADDQKDRLADLKSRLVSWLEKTSDPARGWPQLK